MELSPKKTQIRSEKMEDSRREIMRLWSASTRCGCLIRGNVTLRRPAETYERVNNPRCRRAAGIQTSSSK
ncbi:hypothetical protein E2C01_076776 [Portunus trituberculatus]|uniref:Uncharacterized protein n=1 Tax=Portunus trituberculatus TaxID=210409 RepID=A0A5B7ICM6_PORTR|nr:hypothetical protein [Portunus trituberculatus]